jgi:hypothetical protein
MLSEQLKNDLERIIDEKRFFKRWGQQELPVRTTYPEYSKYREYPISARQGKKADAIRKGIKYKDTFPHAFEKTKKR